jgi:hypothetical protein
MSSRTLELGIQSIRNQQMDEGARLIRIALKGDLDDRVRAAAYLWLAETRPDADFKLDCYRQAQQYDPTNTEISKRISALMTAQLPPTSTQTIPAAPISPPTASAAVASTPGSALGLPDVFAGQPPLDINVFQNVLAISGGPNGVGAGFFISAQGVVATTRFVAGINTQLTVTLNTGQQLYGVVVRSFPAYDLAFVRVNAVVRQPLQFAASPVLMDNTPLLVIDSTGQGTRSTKRATRQETLPHWIPTNLTDLGDAGGDPIYDERGTLLGMMTRNAFRTNNLLYGLSIIMIAQLYDAYVMEARQLGASATYCPFCGALSRAAQVGAFYCECCGAVLPQFVTVARYPISGQQTAALYNETHPPCARCGARVGKYKNKCLRCEDISL